MFYHWLCLLHGAKMEATVGRRERGWRRLRAHKVGYLPKHVLKVVMVYSVVELMPLFNNNIREKNTYNPWKQEIVEMLYLSLIGYTAEEELLSIVGWWVGGVWSSAMAHNYDWGMCNWTCKNTMMEKHQIEMYWKIQGGSLKRMKGDKNGNKSLRWDNSITKN